MIVSPRKLRKSPFAGLLSWAGIQNRNDPEPPVLSEVEFILEIRKERARLERRGLSDTFGLILIDDIPRKEAAIHFELLIEMRHRLRITDSLGWCSSKLAVILPETGLEGSRVVANHLKQIASRFGTQIDPDVYTYPADDDVALKSNELKVLWQYPEEENEDESGNDESGAYDTGRGTLQSAVPDTTVTKSGLNPEPNVNRSCFSVTPPTPVWKRVFDISGALTGLFVLSPIFLVSAIAIRWSSPGPVFFRQVREGKDGSPFYILKFRTMCTDAEELKRSLLDYNEQDGPAFKIEADPRLTTVGRYLRKSCIDELPQLLNILRGEMSLVGPRPLPVNESHNCCVWQRRRLEVVPGLTCIWQVRGGRQVSFSDWMRMDLEYIRRRSLILDIQLLIESFFVAVLHRGSV